MDVSVISSKKENGVTVERLYFSGERTAFGVTRIFARFWLPKEPNPPVVIILDESTKDIDKFDPKELISAGYAVLCVDYSGVAENKERYTIYPEEFDFANSLQNPETVKNISSNPKMSCWYIWTTVLLRAITFAEEDERLSDSIAVMGLGYGSNQVYKVAAIEGDAVKCGLTVFSVESGAEEIADINFKTSLDNAGYVPLARFPILVVMCSNDRRNFFDRMSAMFGLASDNYYLTVGERVGHTVLHRQKKTIESWLSRHLKMGLPLNMEMPVLAAKQSERKLYYEINTDTRQRGEGVELYVAYAMETGQFRNWHKYIPLSAGSGEYIVNVPVYVANKPVYAFASVTYNDGFTFSTPLLSKIPVQIGVQAENFVKSRLIYDSDSGTDDFVSVSGGDDLIMKKGAFDIDGVCSPSGELATYKIGDVQYAAEPDSVLQLILYGEKEQEIAFSVRTVAAGGTTEYVCKKKLGRDNNWTKFTLNAEEFKSKEGALTSFSKAVYFSVRGENILVNSMLWV